MPFSFLLADDVERGAEWAGCAPVAVAAQCPAQHVSRAAVLQCKRRRDGTIACHDAGATAGAMVRDEDFPKLAAVERARGHREGEPLALDREGRRGAAVRKALARGHHARPRSRPKCSSLRSASSRPIATATMAPASRSAAMVASCLSEARPPSALSSIANTRPLWMAITSGTPATTPRPFMIAASMGLR